MRKHYNGSTIVLGVLVLFLLCWLGLIIHFGMPNNAGTFGDQFGAVNALFSALALAGVIYTLIQQQQEMKAQRREFMNSRAYTLAYKQVELINKSIEFAITTQLDLKKYHSDDSSMTFHQLNQWLTDPNEDNIELGLIALDQERTAHHSTLRIVANSCDLLVRLKTDGMSDADANILFNTIRYNIDKEIWKVVENLNELSKTHSALYERHSSKVSESLERINRFNEIYYQIKKDTDDIDGK